MTHLDIIRAWKDEEYRLSLSDAEQALVPAHPAGLTELTDAELGATEGGFGLGGFDNIYDQLTNVLNAGNGCTRCGCSHHCLGFPKLPDPNTLRVNPVGLW